MMNQCGLKMTNERFLLSLQFLYSKINNLNVLCPYTVCVQSADVVFYFRFLHKIKL